MTLHVWLPAIRAGSGTDVFTRRLALGLERAGARTTVTWFPHSRELLPWSLPTTPPAGAQVMHTNSWHGFAFGEQLPAVTTCHVNVLEPSWIAQVNPVRRAYYRHVVRRWERRSVRAARLATAVSEHIGRVLRDDFAVSNPRVIHNWVDTDVFAPAPPASRTGPFRLLFVGNYSRRKGADLLPGIARHLGDGFEIRFTSGLRSAGIPDSLPANMHGVGTITGDSAMAALYASCDALLFPSRSEGFGYAPLEALACGRPVVCTNGSALPEVVRDGVTGLLCPPDDVGAFVAACQKLAADAGLRRRMGEAARQDVLERFSEKKAVTAYLGAYHEALDRPT